MDTTIRDLINAAIAERQVAGKADSKRRRYLGGSQLGHECNRANWYSFHWALKVNVDPRALRIFDRGHREEERMVEWLRLIGCEVEEYDPATVPSLWYHPESDSYVVHVGSLREDDPSHVNLARECLDVTGTWRQAFAEQVLNITLPKPRQFAWKDINGHHCGNCDGRARFVPGVEKYGVPFDAWIGLEFKTHNTKSFVLTYNEGVEKAKPVHWTQMQSYANHMEWSLILYGAVNKNDDDLHFELVPRDFEALPRQLAKATEAIYSIKAPRRVSESPSWYTCRYCDWRTVCHFGAPMDVNCRSCQLSSPVEDGRWSCAKWGMLIPKDAEAAGCGHHIQRTD